MMFVTYLLLTTAIIVRVDCWMNENTSNFNFSCPKGQLLTSIHSMYNKEKKHRLWEFGCSIPTDHSNTTCFPSGYIHRRFAHVTFGCLGQEFITGIYSWSHSNEEHDRGFGTVCCLIKDKSISFCTKPPLKNEVHGLLDFSVPSGRVLTRIISVYDGNTRDRVFQFITCALLRKTVK